jgi:hypothetical protein
MGAPPGEDAVDMTVDTENIDPRILGHISSEQPDPLLDGLRTGSWLDAQIFPPLSYVVPGLIPEGLTLLVGAPKIGKSWLSLAIALAAASGGYALGHVEVGQPRPVLLLALEDGDRRLQARIRKLIPGESIPPLLNYMTRIRPGMLAPTIEAWLATIDHPEPLAILDTLGRILPPAMNGETAISVTTRSPAGSRKSATTGLGWYSPDSTATAKPPQRTSLNRCQGRTVSPGAPTPSSSSPGQGTKPRGC